MQVSRHFRQIIEPNLKAGKNLDWDFVFEQHCPIAFEVVYQWLYTGRVVDDDFLDQHSGCLCPSPPGIKTQPYSCTSIGLHWFRLYKLADRIQILALTKYALGKITDFEHQPVLGVVATAELFTPDAMDNRDNLRDFLVDCTVYSLRQPKRVDALYLQTLFDNIPEFGKAVLRQLVFLTSKDYKGPQGHPKDYGKYVGAREFYLDAKNSEDED